MPFYILFVFLASLAFLAVNELYCVDCIKLMRLGGQEGCEVRYEPGEAYDRVAHAVIGAAIEVHRHLSPGYSEAVYGNALEKVPMLKDGVNRVAFSADLGHDSAP
jgi:hypothetical protein